MAHKHSTSTSCDPVGFHMLTSSYTGSASDLAFSSPHMNIQLREDLNAHSENSPMQIEMAANLSSDHTHSNVIISENSESNIAKVHQETRVISSSKRQHQVESSEAPKRKS